MRWSSATVFVSATLLAAAASGCSKQPPEVVQASGVVRVNGKPLPKASVTFMPMLSDFGGETNSHGETDEQGRYQLTCQFNKQSGAMVGQHIVIVTEQELPDDVRGAQDGNVIDRYRAKLGNRPIPPAYANPGKSPLKVEVASGKPEYDLELTR